eukprot:scaffold48734_cov72-Phaeocystis_antarctica.AAC.4
MLAAPLRPTSSEPARSTRVSLHSVSCCEELAVEMMCESTSAEERRHAWAHRMGRQARCMGLQVGYMGLQAGCMRLHGAAPHLGRVARARQPCDARLQRGRAQLRPDAAGGRAAERTGRCMPLRSGAVLRDGELADRVRAGRVRVQLRRREGQPARRAAHVRERLVDRGARQRACALDVRAVRAALAQRQRLVGGVAALSRLAAEQVVDALEVDLHRAHGDLVPVLQVVAHLGEEVADHAVCHALVRRPQAGGLADRVRLARACLPIGYQRAIVAEEGRADERPADRLEELGVVLAAEDRGKAELLLAATNLAAC